MEKHSNANVSALSDCSPGEKRPLDVVDPPRVEQPHARSVGDPYAMEDAAEVHKFALLACMCLCVIIDHIILQEVINLTAMEAVAQEAQEATTTEAQNAAALAR